MTNAMSAILQTSEALSLPPEQCDPMVNILTFKKWRELGRTVSKGQNSCAKVPVFRDVKAKASTKDASDKKKGKFMATACLFHITQTELFTPKDKDASEIQSRFDEIWAQADVTLAASAF